MAEKERRHEKSEGGSRRWRGGIIKREGWSEEEKKIAFKETESERTQCPPRPASNRRSMEHMRFNVVPIGGNEK